MGDRLPIGGGRQKVDGSERGQKVDGSEKGRAGTAQRGRRPFPNEEEEDGEMDEHEQEYLAPVSPWAVNATVDELTAELHAAMTELAEADQGARGQAPLTVVERARLEQRVRDLKAEIEAARRQEADRQARAEARQAREDARRAPPPAPPRDAFMPVRRYFDPDPEPEEEARNRAPCRLSAGQRAVVKALAVGVKELERSGREVRKDLAALERTVGPREPEYMPIAPPPGG